MDNCVAFSSFLVAIATVALYKATRNVVKATEQVSDATKEMSRTMIRPRPTTIHHSKIGEDDEHHHYQFIIKNFGIGDALNVKIEVLDKNGSAHQTPIPRLKKEQGMAFKATNIQKSKDPVTMKISYQDIMGFEYFETIEYNIANDVFFPQELTFD
ncbi:hypothetical protein [Candidatus Nitrosotenuis aquarius]|uniref:hypothetical protein n=1 Tax=Candidatus Nitrosotenuis aquarius TaxID=1846278 RepID=UPI000C1EDF71|nr:hypothetical protein [Candidatus Nitrosotenuis aquarius]